MLNDATAATQEVSPHLFDRLLIERQIRTQLLKAYSTPPALQTVPSVSVIVLNMQGERVLRRCLECLRDQSYPSFEVILVDNGSTDRSISIAHEFSEELNLNVVHCLKNLGVAGGRNFGLTHVTGEVVAFIDNDGFADRDWLINSVSRLYSAPDIGAVGACVFFADRPIILNGIGGGIDTQGYAADHGYNRPFEFFSVPREVLFPMGCGMVVRQFVLQEIGPLDESLLKWYDDVELGLRVWKKGYRVVTEPLAVVDHDAHSGDLARTGAAWKRDFLFQKARYRTVCKYLPLKIIPGVVLSDLQNTEKKNLLPFIAESGVRMLALCWNLVKLRSAASIRRQLARWPGSYLCLLERAPGKYSTGWTDNRSLKPDLNRRLSKIDFSSKDCMALLNFGWSLSKQPSDDAFARSDLHSSAFLYIAEGTSRVSITFLRGDQHYKTSICIRKPGCIDNILQFCLEGYGPDRCTEQFPVSLPAGLYEIVLMQVKERELSSDPECFGIYSIEALQ